MISEAKPPDGGWGWVVAFCSFVNHMFIFGLLLSMGVVYVSWLEEFGDNKSTTSWIISTCASLCFLSGPIAGSLAAKYGYRFAATVGGLLAAVGFILCYFATSVFYLIIAIGVIAGVSFGFSYLSSLAIVVIYFDKKRALATGIGTSGVGIGSFFLPQMMNGLVENYGWRGCLLILGGLLLNMCITGALMRPLVFKASKYIKDKNMMKGEGEKDDDDDDDDGEDEEERYGKRFEDMMNYHGEGPQKAIVVETEERLGEALPTSTYKIVYREKKEGLVSRKDPDIFRGNDGMAASCGDQEGDDPEALITKTPQLKNSKTDHRYNDLDSCDTAANKIAVNHHLLSHSDEEIISLTTNFDNSKSNAFNELPLLSSSTPNLRTISINDRYVFSNSKSTRTSTSTQVVDKACSEIHSQANHRRLSKWKHNTISIIRSNLKVGKDCAFLLFSISQALVTFSFLTPVIYMVDRAIDNGIPKSQGAWLVSCNGVGSLLGRLSFGLIADRYKNCSLLFHTVLLTATGVATMMSPLCGGSLFLHGAYAAMFGLGMGATSTLVVVLVVDLVGLSRLATAFGILLWFAGLGHLVGPPFAGFIFDVTQSYTVCYVAQGFVLTCSGLMLIPIFYIRSQSSLCCNGASRDLT